MSAQTSALARSAEPIAGVLLFSMIVLFLVGDLSGDNYRAPLTLLAGLCGWAAASLLLPRVRRSQKLLISVLLIVGLVLLFYVWQQGAELAVAKALSINAGLLTMIISVGFLKLVALPKLEAGLKLPVGKAAFRDTLLSIAVFGSFINISAPVLIADRLSQRISLDIFSCATLTRVFSGCSAWSPFFGGMAVVLTYVGGANLYLVMLGGFPFALTGFVVIYLLAVTFHKPEVKAFRGYPMQVSSLWMPAVLAIIVVLMANLMPRLSVLTTIALAALIMTSGTLFYRVGMSAAAAAIATFIKTGLPQTANELLLFLAAGVLAAGLTGIVDLGLLNLPIELFNANSASLLLAVMVFIAMIGIHPVIQVSGFTPLLAGIDPDPLLLALTYLFAWSLGTCASPLSGTHLVMQGRYGIPSWKGAVYNWPFVAIMLIVAIAILQVVSRMQGL